MIEINRNPSKSQLRQFAGIWWPLFCAMVGWVCHQHLEAKTAALFLWIVGGVVAVIGVFFPSAVRRLFVGLLILTYPIGWVVSHVLLALLFYGVITPFGLVARALGRDPLLKGRSTAPTYWRPIRSIEDPDRYFRQF